MIRRAIKSLSLHHLLTWSFFAFFPVFVINGDTSVWLRIYFGALVFFIFVLAYASGRNQGTHEQKMECLQGHHEFTHPLLTAFEAFEDPEDLPLDLDDG